MIYKLVTASENYQKGNKVEAASYTQVDTSISSPVTSADSGYISDFVPKSDTQLRKMFLDIYLHDPIGGSAVDLISVMPFSDFNLVGIKDEKVLQVYKDCLNELSISTFLPELSVEYLVFGLSVSSLLFNSNRGIFTDIIPQNLDYVEINPIPLYNRDPKIDLVIPKEFKEFIESRDPRDRDAKAEVPPSLIQKIKRGKIPLESENTLYVPRKTMTSAYKGISYFERILGLVILEKALFRGTLISAFKRQKSIFHITVGDEDWSPNNDELEAIAQMFMNADKDPVGAIVATRKGIETNEVRSGDEGWKITSDWDTINSLKMKALGINESFLSGDATYNTMDIALSVFIESLRNFRYILVNRVFYQKIFPALARANEFHKTTQAQLDHRIRIRSKDVSNADLLIPEIHWHKQLRPEADSSYMDILNTVKEQGVPIPLAMWASAAGLNLDRIIESLDTDLEYKKEIADYNKKAKKFAPSDEEESFASVIASLKENKDRSKDLISSFNKNYSEKKIKVFANVLKDNSKKYLSKLNGKDIFIDKPEFRVIGGIK